MTDHWYLTPSDFLGGLKGQLRQQFLALGHRLRLRRNDFIFRSGDPGRNVYVLEQGRAKIFKESDSGRAVILWFCLPGELFGLAEATRGGQRDVFAQACTDVVVHRIARERFANFAGQHPETMLQVMDLLSCRLRVLGDILTNLVADDVNSRIIKLLLRLCSRYGRAGTCDSADDANDVCLDSIPLTHQEIADMLGTSRQTVSTIMGDLKRAGVLRKHRGHFHVDPGRLQRLLPDEWLH